MMGRLAAVFQIPGLTIQQRCVLGVLADCENPKDGKCCPKMDTIAKRLGLKLRQVNNIIRELRNLGLIYSHSNGRSNTYTFRFDPIKESNKDDEYDRCATDCIADMQPIAHLGCATDCIADMQPIAHRNSKINGKVKSVNESGSSSTVAYGSTTVGGGGASQQPKTQIKFRKGLEWLAKFTPYKNPFDELFDTTGCLFVAAWDPLFPNEYSGCELTAEQLATIKADPIAFALHLIGEDGSRIARKALANRLEWIGKDHFVGEVARLWYEKSIGRDACKNAGQILLRRLEYVYGIVVGTEHHKHPVNVKILWDFAKAA